MIAGNIRHDDGVVGRLESDSRSDEEDGPPIACGDQPAAERGTDRGSNPRHRSEQPHGAAGLFLRNCLTDERQAEGHHDGRSEALCRPSGNEQPERGRGAFRDRFIGVVRIGRSLSQGEITPTRYATGRPVEKPPTIATISRSSPNGFKASSIWL